MARGMRLRRVFIAALVACSAAAVAAPLRPATGAPCAWSVVPTTDPGPVAALNAISVGRNGTWAAGFYSAGGEFDPEKALIERFDGSWSAVLPSGKGPRTLRGVVSIANNDVWAVGSRLPKLGRPRSVEKTLALHFDGSAWTTVPTPNVGDFGSALEAVDATAPGDVWAVGHSVTGRGKSKALTLHYDGTTWSVVPSPNPKRTARALTGVVAISFRSNAWAVGWTQTGSGEQRPLMERWDGTEWSEQAVPTPTGPAALADIDGGGFNNALLAVGTEEADASSRSYSLSFEEDGWRVVPTALTNGDHELLSSVDIGNEVIAAGWYSQRGRQHTLLETYSFSTKAWSVSPTADGGDAGGYLTDAASTWAVGAYANPAAGSFRPGSHTLILQRTC